jgi:hypothetical protein
MGLLSLNTFRLKRFVETTCSLTRHGERPDMLDMALRGLSGVRKRRSPHPHVLLMLHHVIHHHLLHRHVLIHHVLALPELLGVSFE